MATNKPGYMKEWQQKNKEKVMQYQINYWKKKIAELEEKQKNGQVSQVRSCDR